MDLGTKFSQGEEIEGGHFGQVRTLRGEGAYFGQIVRLRGPWTYVYKGFFADH